MEKEKYPVKEKPFSKFFGKSPLSDFAVSILISVVTVFLYLLVISLVKLSFDAALKAVCSDSVDSLVLKNAGITSLVGNIVALSLAFLLIYAVHGNTRKSLFITVPRFRFIIPAVALGASLNLLSDAAVRLIPFSAEAVEKYNSLYSFLGEGNAFIEFVSVAIAAPAVEELIFRGAVYGTLKRGMPRAAAILISALLFGAAHGNLISFTFTFLLGVALALAFDASRSIFVPIIVHVAFNASSYIITPMMDKAPGAAVPLCIGGAALTALTLFLIIYSREKKTRDDADGESRNGDNTTI